MSNSLPRAFAPAADGFAVEGISHVAVAVADPPAARDFYCSVLGFIDMRAGMLPDCGEHALVRAASGQIVALCRNEWRPSRESAVHQAYRVTAAARDAIAARLRARGIALEDYKEDRPREEADNFYFEDPDANRIQLVATAHGGEGIQAIDHAAIQTIDIEWEEKLYIRTAGMAVEHAVGWRTEDHRRAKLWGEGKEPMIPGARRWDKRYTIRAGEPPRLARPNMQLYLEAGASGLALYLAAEHYRMQSLERAVGTPRLAFKVRADLDGVARKLAAFGAKVAGPVEHPANSPVRRSVYCRDRGGNFVEFCQ